MWVSSTGKVWNFSLFQTIPARTLINQRHNFPYKQSCELLASQCWRSVSFMCGSGSESPDPYLWLMDPDPDRAPTSDPTPFFNDFKDAKKWFFSYFFLQTCPQANHLQLKKLSFLQKFCVQMLFCSVEGLYCKRRGEDTLAGRRGGGGGNSSEDARHCSVLYICQYFVFCRHY